MKLVGTGLAVVWCRQGDAQGQSRAKGSSPPGMTARPRLRMRASLLSDRTVVVIFTSLGGDVMLTLRKVPRIMTIQERFWFEQE